MDSGHPNREFYYRMNPTSTRKGMRVRGQQLPGKVCGYPKEALKPALFIPLIPPELEP